MPMKVLSAPERVTLNITNRCNLACRYCAVSSTKNAPGDLTLAEWMRVIGELARIKVFQVLISGGEPFLRDDFLDILHCIARHPIRIAVNTNGTCFREKILALLAQTGRLNYVQVSLDGPNARVHDTLRGTGSFAMLVKGIDLLRRYQLPFHFFVVVNRINFRHLEEIVHFARDCGANRAAFSALLPQGSALNHLDELMLTFQEQKQAETELRRLKRDYPRWVGGTLLQSIDWMDTLQDLSRKKQQPRKANRITSCGGSVTECAIRPEGWVIPCDRLWGYTVGNVKDTPFQEIWLTSEGFRRFRKRYGLRMDDFTECRGCLFMDVCKGGCPATAYGLGRGITGWDPLSCYQVFSGRRESTIPA
jgi:SynChlorMet cassette radical SAM/SPASM protein ScmE